MVKALWTLLLFGIIAILFAACSDEDGTESDSPEDFYFKTVFRSQGSFSTTCGGDYLIDDYTQVRVFWDWNKNGPDSTDNPVVPPYDVGIPEAMFGAYVDFFVSEPSFVSPVFYCNGAGGMMPKFYLRLYAGENGTTQWTSPAVAIIPHSGPPDTVVLAFDDWTCEFAPEGAPQCQVGSSCVEIHRDSTEVESVCLETCAGRETYVVFAEADSNRAEAVPILILNGSCDETPSASYDFNPALWYRQSYGNFWTLYGFRGLNYGKITLSWLDSVPCTRVDTLVVIREANSTRASWHSEFESSCSSFELWVNGIQGNPENPTMVGTVAASRAPEGSDYEIVFGRLIPGYGYNITLVAVDDDSAKYPCLRQTSN